MPLRGPVGSIRWVDGIWADGWAGDLLKFTCRTSVSVGLLRVKGYVLPQIGEQTLLVVIYTLPRMSRLAELTARVAESFEITIPVSIAKPGEIGLRIGARHTFVPKTAGGSEDIRPLAWRVEELVLEPLALESSP